MASSNNPISSITPSASASASNSDPLNVKPTVIGIYGLPASGKTYLIGQLKRQLGEEHFVFHDGSAAIAAVVPGGLEAFCKLPEHDQAQIRELAIQGIRKECVEDKKSALVAGHFMFWPENQHGDEASPPPVWTPSDAATYTHILYLDVPTEVLLLRRINDAAKKRPQMTVTQLERWQRAEKTQLRKLCYDQGILFSLVHMDPASTLLERVIAHVVDFVKHTEQENMSRAERRLDEVVTQMASQGADGLEMEIEIERMLVIDGDRTLTAQDTGALLWKRAGEEVDFSGTSTPEEDPLKSIFSSRLGYSYTAFRQATLLYEELSGRNDFDELLDQVAKATSLYDDFVYLLRSVAAQRHVRAILVTCGLRQVWEKVLAHAGLSGSVKVIGGGRIADGFVVTAAVKTALVSRLQSVHCLETWAFGDSVLDLGMLSIADRAIIVVGDAESRSKSMEAALETALDNGNIQDARVCQVVMASGAPPRLNATKLPVTTLTDPDFMQSMISPRGDGNCVDLHVLDVTNKNAAKILTTPTRDASVAGPALREAHRRVGWFLAHAFVPAIVGVEDHQIPHVQGHSTEGHGLLDESHTMIVALMRGGDPMALGVSEAFPLAVFVHANCPTEITGKHLQMMRTIILVDSVINSGKSVVEFIQRVWELKQASSGGCGRSGDGSGNGTIRIIVVAGVVQLQAIDKIKSICGSSKHRNRLSMSLVALRLSDNKFTGKRGTDTGNRLFNTTFLD
jgi:uracil phosphoribosyltransferase/adenylate kinase/phosphoserine phosphatase